jgi:hypothetical protein
MVLYSLIRKFLPEYHPDYLQTSTTSSFSWYISLKKENKGWKLIFQFKVYICFPKTFFMVLNLVGQVFQIQIYCCKANHYRYIYHNKSLSYSDILCFYMSIILESAVIFTYRSQSLFPVHFIKINILTTRIFKQIWQNLMSASYKVEVTFKRQEIHWNSPNIIEYRLTVPNTMRIRWEIIQI